MKSKSLTIERARNLVDHGMALRAAISGSLREGKWVVVLFKVTEEGESEKKKFVEFHELQLANESKTRIFKSLDAAAGAIFDGVKLSSCSVWTMTPPALLQLANGVSVDASTLAGADVQRVKTEILQGLGAEERR